MIHHAVFCGGLYIQCEAWVHERLVEVANSFHDGMKGPVEGELSEEFEATTHRENTNCSCFLYKSTLRFRKYPLPDSANDFLWHLYFPTNYVQQKICKCDN